jgi:thiosulfate reductase cytochrome b subunit
MPAQMSLETVTNTAARELALIIAALGIAGTSVIALGLLGLHVASLHGRPMLPVAAARVAGAITVGAWLGLAMLLFWREAYWWLLLLVLLAWVGRWYQRERRLAVR